MEFELPGDEVIMHRDGDRLVIEPVRKRGLIAFAQDDEAARRGISSDPRSRAGAGAIPVTRYMPDTNIISNLIRTISAPASSWRRSCATDARRAARKRLLKAVEDLLGEINVLSFDVPVDAEYGGIRSELEAGGRPIGSDDMLIAAHAYATGAPIVTANADEFKRISGLNVENWLA